MLGLFPPPEKLEKNEKKKEKQFFLSYSDEKKRKCVS
jgi:hypothetical protein